MNNTAEQLKLMEVDRQKLVEKLNNAKTEVEKQLARLDLKAHDQQVGKLLGLKFNGKE
jgi:hypothetical protein